MSVHKGYDGDVDDVLGFGAVCGLVGRWAEVSSEDGDSMFL
jgi:hypothetical protein